MVKLPKEEVPKGIPFSKLVSQKRAEKVQEMLERMDYIISGQGTVYLTNLIEAADLVVHNTKIFQIPNLYQKTLNFLRAESNLVSSLIFCFRQLILFIVVMIQISNERNIKFFFFVQHYFYKTAFSV